MSLRINLSRTQIAELAAVRDLGTEQLGRITDALVGLDPPPLRPDRLVDAITGVNIHKDVAEKLVRQILSIHRLIRQVGVPVELAFSGIRQAIDTDSNWDAQERQRWNTIEQSVQKMVSSRPITLVARAIDLSYEYANLLRRARILTDIRPLFNDEGTTIDGSVISHTLRIKYDTANVDHSLSIAMDESDIKELLKQCERALIKARTARDLAEKSLNIPTIISGGSDNA